MSATALAWSWVAQEMFTSKSVLCDSITLHFVVYESSFSGMYSATTDISFFMRLRRFFIVTSSLYFIIPGRMFSVSSKTFVPFSCYLI